MRAQLRLSSALMRHALRLSFALAAGYAVMQFADDSHGFWILLTIVFVGQSEYGATLTRLVQRVWGTGLGLVVGWALLRLFPGVLVQSAFSVMAGALFFATRHNSYTLATAAATSLVLLSFNQVGDGFDLIMPRLVALYALAPWTSGALWKKMPIAQAALRRRAVFDDREAVVAAYTGRGAFKTWPETMLADYVDGGFVDRDDGKVELACAPAWEASNYSAQAHDPWRAIRKVTGPVRILRAERGSTCRIGDRFARRGRDVTVETVAGTSHFLPMERPDLARDAIFAMATL
ncbi:MAG: hypothetical protein B7Y78_14200 [Caulobacter sp. 35-67-4]|nr:MAG: hypothetical protein B7Y78_14200 [Caulobacter sp. 35-67-4]